MFAGSWNWRGESLTRPPRGYDPEHPFIEDIKRKDFVESVVLSEEQVCGPRFMREFVAVCKTMLPPVEFTTGVLGLKFKTQAARCLFQMFTSTSYRLLDPTSTRSYRLFDPASTR